jgi:peptide subunit release factor 1 (eRF1)/intein/homing endonuclease
MTSEDIRKRRLKDLVEELDGFRGRHTELVSVYIPAGFNLFKVVEQINNEKSTAQNIKSKAVRKNVMSALERITQHLKLYKQTPPNGLVVFSGNISEREGVADIELFVLEPPEPLNQRLYWCDQKFVLDPLKEMIREREIFGIVVLDKSEGDVGVLIGKKVKPLKHLDSLVPGKTDKGGWCVHEDALMQMSDGKIRKIKDIGNDNFMCYDFKKLAYATGKHNHYFKRTSDKAYEITTKAPTISIKVTPEHKFFVPGSSGFEEKSAENLDVGDSILLSKNMPVQGKKEALSFEIPYTFKLKQSGRNLLLKKRKKLKIFQKKAAKAVGLTQTAVSKFELGKMGLERKNLNKLLKLYRINAEDFERHYLVKKSSLKFPKQINSELASFLGYVLGDGNKDENRISISENEEEVARKYKKTIEKTFGINAALRFRAGKGYWELRINSKGLLEIIDNLFPEVLRPHGKNIPESVCSLPSKELSGFLRGFFDAEGWINEGSRQIGLTTNMKHAMRSLQLMLLRFGIISSLREVGTKGSFAKKQKYCVRITDYESLKRFGREIGFSSRKKSDILKSILRNSSEMTYCDQIPIKGSYVLSLAHKLGLTTDDFPKTQDFFFDKKNMSYRIFRQNILSVFRKKSPGSEITKFMESIATSDIISARIASKKPIKTDGFFYDMEVPARGNFIANGIILHNSQARYARIREGLLNDFMKKVGEVASQQLSEFKDMIGVIVGGPGPVKDTFANGDFLRYDLKNKIISVVDTSYTGEYGLGEAVDRSEEALKEASVMKEKKLLARFFNELGRDSGLAVYGLKETIEALELGTVEILFISEHLDWVKARIRCPKCNEEKDVVTTREKLEAMKCPKCNELYEILAEKDLTDEILKKAESMDTQVEMISSDTKEGNQLKEMGGIGGIMRYKA